jgi:hypothetical protein
MNAQLQQTIFNPYTKFIIEHSKKLNSGEPFVSYETVGYYLLADMSANNFMIFPSVIHEKICQALSDKRGRFLMEGMQHHAATNPFESAEDVLKTLQTNMSIPLVYLKHGCPWLLGNVFNVEPDWIVLRRVTALTNMEDLEGGGINFISQSCINADYFQRIPQDFILLKDFLIKDYLSLSKRHGITVLPICTPTCIEDCGGIADFETATKILKTLSEQYFYFLNGSPSKVSDETTLDELGELFVIYMDHYQKGCAQFTLWLENAK